MVQHSTGNQLVDTAAARKNLELESDNLNSNLGKKLRMMDELSKERVVVLSDLQHANYELERMNRQHLSLNHENIDMENHVQRLQSERHELLRNLEQLTITYDDCVHDITRERRNMDGQNDW
jgi:chromosome segregation ATPase